MAKKITIKDRHGESDNPDVRMPIMRRLRAGQMSKFARADRVYYKAPDNITFVYADTSSEQETLLPERSHG